MDVSAKKGCECRRGQQEGGGRGTLWEAKRASRGRERAVGGWALVPGRTMSVGGRKREEEDVTSLVQAQASEMTE